MGNNFSGDDRVKRFAAIGILVIITGVLAACGRDDADSRRADLGNVDLASTANELGADFVPALVEDDIRLPALSFEYLLFTNEVQRLLNGASNGLLYNGLGYRSSREENADFIIDLVYPISASDILNNLTSGQITDFVDNFLVSNNSGSIYVRPATIAYNGHVLGISIDFRYYGDNQGFGAERFITSFDLEQDLQILPEQLFAPNVDFRAIFAVLANALADIPLNGFMALSGHEDFTFDDDYIYLHMRVHEIPTAQGSYKIVALPLTEFAEMWIGPPPAVNGPRVAITFDDGPHGRFTPQLLDALAARNVSATFFLMGPTARAYPQIVERIHREGHQIGNHSYSHVLLTRLTRSQIRREIVDTNNIIYDIIGEIPTLVRPPFGGYNNQVLEIMSELGKSIVNWSVDPRDWYHRNAEVVRDNIVQNARDGSIILLHDIHESSIQGAIMAIDILLARGYNFVTVGELYRYSEFDLIVGGVHRGIYREN
jgi:peptidoglycan/xylan/chitin deacetylase (PgdA/CDA1 family)